MLNKHTEPKHQIIDLIHKTLQLFIIEFCIVNKDNPILNISKISNLPIGTEAIFCFMISKYYK